MKNVVAVIFRKSLAHTQSSVPNPKLLHRSLHVIVHYKKSSKNEQAPRSIRLIGTGVKYDSATSPRQATLLSRASKNINKRFFSTLR